MSEQEKSGLHIYSLGMVANNKELDSDIIQVVPMESTPFIDGEIASMPFDVETEGQDANGGNFNVKVTTDQAIEAKWLRESHSNRLTPPDVRRGMRVLLWRFADENAYRWTDIGLDRHLLKLETVVYQFSATSDEAVDSTELANSYYLEVSSHKKLITLQTSKANGEFCVYALQMNMADGRVLLTDELGNSVTLDSQETEITLENAETTMWSLSKRDLLGYAPDNMIVHAEKSIQLTTKAFKLQCETGTIDASSSLTITTPKLQGNIDNTSLTGNVEVGKNLAVGGSSNFAGAMTAAGIVSSKPIRGPSNTI